MRHTILTIAGLALFAAAPLSAQTPVAPVAPTQAAPPHQTIPAAPEQTMTAVNPQTISIRLKFVPGTVWTYKAALDMTAATSMGDQPTPTTINVHTEMTIDETIVSVGSDGDGTLKTKIGNYSLTVNGQPFPVSDAIRAQMNNDTTIVMSPTGKVISTSAPKAAVHSLPGMNFGKSAFSGFSGVYPASPVKIGASWATPQSFPMFSGLSFIISSTLAGIDRSSGDTVATIKNISQGNHGSRTSILPAQKRQIFGSMAGAGESQFDIDAGRLNSMSNDMTIKITDIPKASDTSFIPATGIKTNMHIVMKMDLVPNVLGTGQPAAK